MNSKRTTARLTASLAAAVFAATAAVQTQGAWFYPQMELEIHRLGRMQSETERTGMLAAHPGEVPEVRREIEFRRPNGDGKYETVKRTSPYRQPVGLRSDKDGWEAQTFDGVWRKCAKYADSERPAHLVDMPEDRTIKPLKAGADGIYDFGTETLAYLECEADAEPEFRVGESLDELEENDPQNMEYVPRMIRVGDRRWRTPVPYAFRYFRWKTDGKTGLTCFPTSVKVVPVGRKHEKRGTFHSPNERWNRMFEVAERTLHLCSQDFLIDGIKRDRLPWAGDLAVSLMANAYIYGDAEIVRRTLSVMDAYTGDVNGIVTYSMWTIISHDLYQLYYGDRAFLEDRWWRVKWRVENLVSRCDERGFVVKGNDWVFVDWTKEVDPSAAQMIWVGALDAAARLADRVGDEDAAKYRSLAAKVRRELNAKHWDEAKGMYGVGRHASIYAVIFDVADAAKMKRIGANLAKNEIAPVGTPYVYGWELIALKRAGYVKEFFAGIEKVFGAMLDAGATTFWEGYDAKEKGAERYRFYGRPFGKSLCHVWSAWPAILFVSEVMGVKPTSDGWKTWEQKPLPGVTGLSATLPSGISFSEKQH